MSGTPELSAAGMRHAVAYARFLEEIGDDDRSKHKLLALGVKGLRELLLFKGFITEDEADNADAAAIEAYLKLNDDYFRRITTEEDGR